MHFAVVCGTDLPSSSFLITQQDRDRLLAEVENLAANSDGQAQKLQDIHSQKLKALEAQVDYHFL